MTTPPADLRMTPDDVTALVNWQNANNFKLVMAYNAEESVSRIAGTGSDPLTAAFLAEQGPVPLAQPHLQPRVPLLHEGLRHDHEPDRDARRGRYGRCRGIASTDAKPATSSG